MRKIWILNILLGIGVVILSVISCNDDAHTTAHQSVSQLRVAEFQGCEYVILSQYVDGSGVQGITHKGNCKNMNHE